MQSLDTTVRRGEDGMRLLDFLAARLQTSRKKAKRLLDERCVFVNGRRTWMARHVVRAGHGVTVATGDRPAAPGADIPVVYEDEDYWIVNKPAGLLSTGDGSLEEQLRAEHGNAGVSVVHRLDRDTTGCLLVARSEAARRRAVELFRRREVSKTYHAIVAGRLRSDASALQRPLDGRRAVTLYRILDAGEEATHVQIKLVTGRTHQIRRHFHAVHHPVLGDRQYGTRVRLSRKGIRIGRQMLHASDMALHHPGGGAAIRARAPLPRDFRQCLRTFGLS